MYSSGQKRCWVRTCILIIIFMDISLMFILSGCSIAKTKDIDLSSNYEIVATLDSDNRTLAYTAQVNVQNDGQDSIAELYFHLYGNMYKSDDSNIAIVSVTDNMGTPISFKMEDDNQLIRVALNDALDSGNETVLIFTCMVTIPIMEDRYGIARDGEIQMSLFYPQLSVYDGNGWNTAPMNTVGDGRYAEMSNYTLTIEVPSQYELACNGMELSRKENGDVTTYIFQADARREIIFIAFTDYVRMERSVGETKILGYFNRSRSRAGMEQVMDAAAFSMEYYSKIFTEYPYDTLVVTNGAWATKREISMEYSGLITVAFGDEDYANTVTTYHEMAHQWFYSLVGNDESAEPWLDESFATFSTALCLEASGYEVSEAYWKIYEIQSNSADGVGVNCAYDEAQVYEWVFYGRGSIFLKELMDTIGKVEFLSILSDYCQTYSYQIVSTQDFLEILREQTNCDIESIIEKYIS